MKPHVTLLMLSSLDGHLHPSRFTRSPDGGPKEWRAVYERIHDEAGADAWLVGRVTMAEMIKAGPHRPASLQAAPIRPVYVANPEARRFAVATDKSGKLRFDSADVGGDHVVVLLGAEVSDEHLAGLMADGVSYIVSPDLALAALLETLNAAFGIERMMLEGGGVVNGAFLAAGIVDELQIVMAPALDAAPDVQGIVVHPNGLAGNCELSLASIIPREHGLVQLTYTVSRKDADPSNADPV